jgi:HK97 gp10 family phage protein
MTDVVIDTVKLDQLIKDAPEMVDKAIRATAFSVEASAKMLAAVDTGAMRASIFTKTSRSNGFDAAGEGVIGKNAMVEPMDPTPTDCPLMTAYVAPGVNYAYWVEFGTGKMAARPFLTPAVEKANETFVKQMQEVFKDGAW